MGKIEQIKNAITKAANNESKLTKEILDLPSFSSHKIKHLLNNLGEIGTNYIEAGIHKAGMFISANYENNMVSTGVDNYSELEQDGLSKRLAYEHCKKYLTTTYKIEEVDVFDYYWNSTPLGGIYDFYLYDGNHSRHSHKRALTQLYNIMKDECIFCVDDSSWQDVIKGTKEGLKQCEFEILFEQHLWDGKESGDWWNGFSVYLLKKPLYSK